MNILLIDTSSFVGLCAVMHFDEVKAVRYIRAESSHAECLFEAIAGVLKDSSISIADVTDVVYSAGPGSFTGLRIAYSAVMGISTSKAEIKIHPVSTLYSLCANLKGINKTVCALVKSSSDDVFALIKSEDETIILDEACLNINELIGKLSSLNKEVFCIGSGATHYKKELKNISNVIIPENDFMHMINPASMKLSINNYKSLEEINYLKDSYARVSSIKSKEL